MFKDFLDFLLRLMKIMLLLDHRVKIKKDAPSGGGDFQSVNDRKGELRSRASGYPLLPLL